MLKLNTPTYSYEETIDNCLKGITGNDHLLNKLENGIKELLATAANYNDLASKGELYTIRPTQKTENDPKVIEQLKKSELINLYSYYLTNSKKPGRIIYDSLLAGASEKCPFCGGIGLPRNLDHYLPKGHYPQFSILPINLVPSCRDCNMDGKGENFATIEEEQIIHPYLDNDCYFSEQWIFAKYTAEQNAEPGVLEYFAQPPEHWNEPQKRRAEKHFKEFSLGLRYSKEASARLGTYLLQIKNLLELSLDIEIAKKTILGPVINSTLFANHWERIMCSTLMDELKQ